MLSLRISLEDAGKKCSFIGKVARLGESFIECFSSSQITMSSRRSSNRNEIWVGEDRDPIPPAIPVDTKIEKYRSFLDFEGIKIFAGATDAGPAIKIVRTGRGGCPVYVAANGNTLVASWKFEDAVQAVRIPKPNVEACRIYLTHGHCQVREMIIDGVFMLWPGETASFDANGLSFDEAPLTEVVLPGTLHDSARVTDAFLAIIADSVQGNISRSVNPLVEISGGLDSACVALAMAPVSNNLSSYAVVHGGAMGIQQHNRRKEIIGLLGSKDFEFPSFQHPPLASLDIAEYTFTIFDDIFRIPCVYAVDAHPVGNFDLVVSGIGGDELTKESTHLFRKEWEVASNICTSATVSAFCRADMFMRRGIWPINPLTHQHVVDFCRALPIGMREGRLLNILTLARLGLSDGFLFPRYREHYGNMLQSEAALFDFDKALASSIVADFRIFDFSSLLGRAREASLGGFSYELIIKLHDLLKLEAVLRRYVS